MTYRHHSQRCHHRVQTTDGSNQHQLRITCQECQGHLAIVYGKHLNRESRQLIREHLNETPLPVRPPMFKEPPPGRPEEPPPVQRKEPPPVQWPPPMQWKHKGPPPVPRKPQPPAVQLNTRWETPPVPQPQPSARAVDATHEPRDEPEPSVRQEDVEVSRARMIWQITELHQEIRRLTAELEALPRQATPPPQARNPEADPEEMPRAQGSPQQHRPHP